MLNYGGHPNPLLKKNCREVKKRATTSLWSVKQRIDHVVKYTTNKSKTKNNNFGDLKVIFDYIINPDKTEKQFLLIESFK